MKNQIISKKRLDLISGYVILLCAVLLGFETYFREETYSFYFEIFDIGIIVYFVFEILLRFKYKLHSFAELPGAIKKKIFHSSDPSQYDANDGEIIEEWFWLIFDLSLVILGCISLARHFISHPQIILILRLFRVFRIFRVFDFNKSLMKIERKIFSVIPTVITFFGLVFLIIYVYSILGMYLYDFSKFDTVDFSNLHTSISTMFTLMSNGWSDALFELKKGAYWVNPLISEFFIFSFFIFSVLVTMNIFLAVMTTQIQDKLEHELELIQSKEDIIIGHEIESEEAQDELDKKLEFIISELANIKKEINEMRKE